MIVKGIVESVISKTELKVRIPFLNGAREQVDSATTDELPSASVCQIPNVDFEISIGDIVWIEFENNRWESPVIIGFLNNSPKTTVDYTAKNINVSQSATLPTDTRIGEVLPSEIDCLRGVTQNLGDYLQNTSPCYIIDLTGYSDGDTFDISLLQQIPDGSFLIAEKESVAGTKVFYPLLEKTKITIGDDISQLEMEDYPQYNYVFANVYGAIKIVGNRIQVI